MHRTLIVAKLKTDSPERIADVFAESDATDLPRMVGVSRRTLFNFHDLYFHLVETDEALKPQLTEVRRHPLFKQIDEGLSTYVKPYHPSWREPKDAMAATFYEWTRNDA